MTIPGSTLPKSHFYELIHVDKWVHICMFGILVFLFLQAVRLFNKNVHLSTLFIVPVCGIAYGTGMEFVQKYWTTGRSFDIWDIVADSIGCLLAYAYVSIRVKYAAKTALSTYK